MTKAEKRTLLKESGKWRRADRGGEELWKPIGPYVGFQPSSVTLDTAFKRYQNTKECENCKNGAHPLDTCKRVCWDRYYGLRNHT